MNTWQIIDEINREEKTHLRRQLRPRDYFFAGYFVGIATVTVITWWLS